MADMISILSTINNAVYGKEMRPAIIEGLSFCFASATNASIKADKLNERVDNLIGGGGGGTPSYGDELTPPILVVNGAVTALEAAGIPNT